MAINIVYGPIAKALGLAQVGGAGAGYNNQAQRDLQALQIQNQMQNSINTNDTNLIQMSMARDQAAQANALHQQQLQQQAVQQQAQNEMAQQVATRNSQAQATREEQSQAITAAKALELKDKQARDAWLQTLTPEQRNAVLSGAGLPIQKPAPDQSENNKATDQRMREQAALEYLKTKAEMDARAEDNLRRTLLPNPTEVEQAHKQTQASLQAYQTAADKFATGPANIANFDTNPVNSPSRAQVISKTGQDSPPIGPSPYGVGGRKQMPNGSVWTWNGISWTKG